MSVAGLITEEEYEYAERAGSASPYYWGADAGKACQYENTNDKSHSRAFKVEEGNICDDGYAVTSPVGKFKRNAFGLYDMDGNVESWVQDCEHLNYKGAPTDGGAWLGESKQCDFRMLRGGSWAFPVARSAERSATLYTWLSTEIGFRIAKSL